jgi:hypothetical protein
MRSASPLHALGLALLLAGPLAAAAPPETAPAPPPDAVPSTPRVAAADLDVVRGLLEELNRLHDEMLALRAELADARLEASAARREAEELRTYIEDHATLGDDFERYRGVKAAAERQEQRALAEAARQRHEQEKAARQARLRQARAEREEAERARDVIDFYRDRGFEPIGMDVYASRVAYSYGSADATQSRIDYAPGFGHYLRLYPGFQVDYTRITISGSVVNGADELRHVGIAIAFFDEAGNQVGHETVQVQNARPNVPYPFTSTIALALDRPFASATQYVLYADPAAPVE